MKNNGKVKLSDLARFTMCLELMGAIYSRATVAAMDNETKKKITTIVICGFVFDAESGKYMFTLNSALKMPDVGHMEPKLN